MERSTGGSSSSRGRGGGGWNGGNDGGGRGRGGGGGWSGGNEGGGRGRGGEGGGRGQGGGGGRGGGGRRGQGGGRSPQQSYYHQQQYQQEPHPQNERRSGYEESRGGRGGGGPRPQSYAGATSTPPQHHRQEVWRNRNEEVSGGRPDQQVRVNHTSPPPPPADDRTSSSSPPPSGQSTDHNVRRMSSSPPALVVDNPDNKIVPIKRPDVGGKMAMRRALLRVNHFPVKFNPETVIRHYDVDIKPTAPPTNGKQTKLSKVTLRRIRDKLFADDPSEFPLAMTAYDGEKNIFSAVPLPVGKFKVEFDESDDMRTKSYTFSIKLVNELKLCKLKDYLSGRLNNSIPRNILQGMDVVMKEHPVRHMISVGRSFHPFANNQNDDLGYGITASRGFQPSLKPTFQGVSVCLDYSVLSFRKRLPVLDFLSEHIPGLNMNDFGRFRRDVEGVMGGLKVYVTHRVTKQKYLVAKLTKENTRFLTFPTDDPDGGAPSQVSVVDYFRQKYQKEIMHLDIPCLDLGKNNRKNYVPMEFCVLVEGQIYPKEHLDRNAAYVLKNMSLATPQVRQNTINDMMRARDGPCGGDIIRNFGMEVSTTMTSVEGRVIGPPELKVGTPSGRPIKITVDKEKCHWNLVGKGVVEGRPIDRWAIIDFSSADRCRLNHSQFVPQLVSRCNSLGIPMSEPLFSVPATMNEFANADRLRQLLESINDRALRHFKGRLQFVLCVMSRRDEGYKYLKWVSEIVVGVVTQCCLSTSKLNDQYFANLALKINAKLGGSNVELSDRLPYFGGENHVMFIGADVNHPAARNKTSPSIAAVVATVNWPAANRYAARVCPQDHRTEKILNFGDMCVELVQIYARLNKVKPEKIVVFRDGVSDGQFDMVLNEELLDLKKSFQSINYNPTITLIVAQKRHQTRLFPEGERGRPSGNVAPGTVVDTKIVHPFEYDFYLCSHYGSLGTSKPTHYHVLWDEHSLSSDVLQKLIYNMCFTFARCTKPVSLVPPVYYADLAAFRGRMYHDAVEGQSPASSSSSRTSSTLSVAASMDDKSYKLHANLENNMFFV